MSESRIEVLGVYRVPVTEELFQKQFKLLYGYRMTKSEHSQAERQCREQLSSTVLVEVIVSNVDSRFKVGDFTQPWIGRPRESWQVAYEEAFLAADGEARLPSQPSSDNLRVAFFLHLYDARMPLYSSYGDLACPPPKEMPERLKALVPYIPVD